jgi:hypothetical protein
LILQDRDEAGLGCAIRIVNTLLVLTAINFRCVVFSRVQGARGGVSRKRGRADGGFRVLKELSQPFAGGASRFSGLFAGEEMMRW